MFIFLYFLLFSYFSFSNSQISSNRSFLIDYENNRFLKNGQPYRYISGSVHYFRIPDSYWNDRLMKTKAAGLNAIEFYIPWNMHELRPGEYDFSGIANFTKFLQIAQQNQLDVILRMGPYTCGELDNGGLPWWLLKLVPDMIVRSKDTRYLYYVTKWYFKLFPMILPFLYKNGGPIIMLQVENEYGSYYACDQEYMGYLRDLFRSYVGDDVVLFTVDGGSMGYLKCGYTPGLYPTVDFGPGDRLSIATSFAAQRAYSPRGPLVNTEFYPGWLDLWGLNHSVVATKGILDSMQYMYESGASFNFYMFHGGTTFGYWNGAVGTRPCVTSYDYDSPLSEAGDPTSKYLAIRSMIENLTGIDNPYPIPKSNPKRAYGPIDTTLIGSIIELLPFWKEKRIESKFPLTFEAIDFGYGYVLYETIVPFDVLRGNLSITGIRDRGYVMIDGQVQGIVSNLDQKYVIQIVEAKKDQKLQILVENSGRHTQGPCEPKGLVKNVTLDGRLLIDWILYPINIQDLFTPLKWDKPQRILKNILKSNRNGAGSRNDRNSFTPSIYYAKFVLDDQPLEDTFFNPGNWSRGQFFLNDFNVGRYWPSLGPQVTLYIPKSLLKSSINYGLLFELEKPGDCLDDNNGKCSINFIDYPILNKTVITSKNNGNGEEIKWPKFRREG